MEINLEHIKTQAYGMMLGCHILGTYLVMLTLQPSRVGSWPLTPDRGIIREGDKAESGQVLWYRRWCLPIEDVITPPNVGAL